MSGGVWPWPTRHTLSQRLRSSEVKREQAGQIQRLALPNMQPIAGVRHRTCQWVIAETRPALFCAAPVMRPGCSWCADHARIVFAPAEEPCE